MKGVDPFRLRDRPYAASRVVYVIRDLAPATLAGLDSAFRSYLAEPGSVEFRDRLRDASPAGIAAAVAASVIDVDGDPSDHELVMRANATPYLQVPAVVLRSTRAVAISVGHGSMDGGPILEFVTWLITVAAGGTGRRDDRPVITWPLVRGLRKVGRGGFDAFRAVQGLGTVPPVQSAEPTPDDLELRNARIVTRRLTRADFAASGAAGRASTESSRVVSAGMTALRRVYRGTEDLPVIVPVDLRRHVKGGRVIGNFMGVAAPASLLASDWSAAAVTGRLSDALTSGAAMVSNVQALARWLKYHGTDLVRRRRREPSAGALSMFIPILGNRRGFPEAAWLPDGVRRVAVVSLDVWPSGTELALITLRDELHLTVWDDTGLFDLDRFDVELDAAIVSESGTAMAEGSDA